MKQSKENNESFKKIIDLLHEENHHHNLSGIKDWQGMYAQHIEDSLAIAEYIEANHPGEDKKILDLGSGAGFPGIVIAICSPNKKVIMIESNNKKVSFIKKASESIGLKNTEAVLSRIEEFPELGAADIVCAKALSSLDVLLEYACPLLKVGGSLISMKSLDIEEELANAAIVWTELGFEAPTHVAYSACGKKRQLVVFKKSKSSKIKLPRNNGEAKNKPLRGLL